MRSTVCVLCLLLAGNLALAAPPEVPPPKSVKVQVWQGTGSSKQMIGHAEVTEGARLVQIDNRLYAPSLKGGARYDEVEVPVVRLIPVRPDVVPIEK